MTGGLLAGALVVYNLVSPWRGGLGYVVANLSVGAAAAVAATMFARTTADDLGLRGSRWITAAKAAVVAAVLTSPLYAVASSDATANLVADERTAGLEATQVAFNMLVRIPLGTALAEEMAFRGVLFGVFRPWGFRAAALASSIAFGLWHIRPAVALVRANAPETGAARLLLVVAVLVVVTGAAGAALCWMREKTKGIAAPWAFHATLNSLALGASVFAHSH